MVNEEQVINKLRDYLIWSKFVFLQYKKLFLGKRKIENSILIKKTAPMFFTLVYQYYWERMILSISKLSDKYKEKNNLNLSIEYIVELSRIKKMFCHNSINENYEKLKPIVKNIRKYRSKIVAHKDLNFSLSSNLNISISEIEQAFSIMEKIMEDFLFERNQISQSFNALSSDDVGSLLYYLEQALIYDEMKKERNDLYKDNLEEKKWIDKINNDNFLEVKNN